MDLSVIIPTLNEAAQIALAIDCAVALHPREVVVSDGQSTDDTAAIANRKRAVVVVGPRGRGEQLNRGANLARGEVLLFLHADTWLEPSAAMQIESAVAGSDVQCGAFRQRIEASGMLYRCLEAGNAWRAGRWGMPYGDQGIFVHRGLFERLGGFPLVPIMEDVLLMRQMRRQSRPVLLPGPLHVSARRWQKNGVIRQTARNWFFLLAQRAGVSPNRLSDWYDSHRRGIAIPRSSSSSRSSAPRVQEPWSTINQEQRAVKSE